MPNGNGNGKYKTPSASERAKGTGTLKSYYSKGLDKYDPGYEARESLSTSKKVRKNLNDKESKVSRSKMAAREKRLEGKPV